MLNLKKCLRIKITRFKNGKNRVQTYTPKNCFFLRIKTKIEGSIKRKNYTTWGGKKIKNLDAKIKIIFFIISIIK
jgi:hypothetical protein